MPRELPPTRSPVIPWEGVGWGGTWEEPGLPYSLRPGGNGTSDQLLQYLSVYTFSQVNVPQIVQVLLDIFLSHTWGSPPSLSMKELSQPSSVTVYPGAASFLTPLRNHSFIHSSIIHSFIHSLPQQAFPEVCTHNCCHKCTLIPFLCARNSSSLVCIQGSLPLTWWPLRGSEVGCVA